MSKAMEMYQCQKHYCGYVYDPGVGDTKRDIPVGTLFEDLPDNWKCPFCGAEKKSFKPLAGPGSVLWENIQSRPGMEKKSWEEIESHIANGEVDLSSPPAERAKGTMV